MGLSGLVRPGWPTGWSDYSRGWLVMARPTKPRTSVTATVRLRRPLQPVGVARTETTETHRNQNLHHIIHASRQLSLGISSVIWRGRPWVSSVDTWRGRPTAPVDMAHRTACIHIKYIAYTNKARYIYIYICRNHLILYLFESSCGSDVMDHRIPDGSVHGYFIKLRRPGNHSVLARWNEATSFSREQATVEKKMFNRFVQITTSTSGRGTKFKTELMWV
jgi:hypothetical protein